MDGSLSIPISYVHFKFSSLVSVPEFRRPEVLVRTVRLLRSSYQRLLALPRVRSLSQLDYLESGWTFSSVVYFQLRCVAIDILCGPALKFTASYRSYALSRQGSISK